MITFTPAGDNLFNIESDLDFKALLNQSEKLLEEGDVEGACQLRLNTAIAALEAIDSQDDDVELDMENTDNHPFVEIISNSGLDHYLICDFDTAAAMFETVLELDSEDHLGVIAPLAYCYVALEEQESLEEIADLIQFSKLEQNFFDGFSKFIAGQKVNFSEQLKEELSNPDSELRAKLGHLILNFPQLEEQLS